MAKIFSYSFSLTPPAPAEQMHEYSYSEFLLDLPSHWKQVPNATDNTLNFSSETHSAALIISADFYEIPDSKAQSIAEKCLDSRLEALEELSPGQVEVLHRTIKPHSGGSGLELSFAAEAHGHVHIYLGYVTSRKILNVTLIAPPSKQSAAALFNKTVANFRPKLP
ncbi:hypothetical protein [Pelomonas sp. SE-A7]|uniref:hypothetical protein n=1 Tax=Pelomonas sp. SE-A7 TaxID=3054953 RepID=UPI00259CBF00|nr:hypothetical protein [Pelomonas sp. SE-A7]MDM4767188.1 hypothetical protein [Pelomonas sp. SE-A7]